MKTNKVALLLLKIVVSALSLYLIFSRSDIGHVYALMKQIGPFYMSAAALLYVISQVGSTYRWKLLLPDKFTVRRLFSLYMIGSFFNTFLPGAVGGDFVKAYYLNKDAKKLSLTLASIFMDRYLGFVSLMIIGIVTFPFVSGFMAGSVYQWSMPVIFVSFIVASFLFFGLQLGRRFKTVSEFYDYFVTFSARKSVLVKAVVWSLVIQMIGFSAVALLAFAIGVNIPLYVFLAFLPIIVTITTIPISISGIGLRENGFAILLGLLGVKQEVAIAISLSWFFSTFLGSLPGLVAYIRQSNRAKAL